MLTWIVEHGMVPLLVPGRCRMFSSVGEHGMVPILVPGVFPPVGFSMQAHMFFRDTWHHPYISSCFCGKHYLMYANVHCIYTVKSCTHNIICIMYMATYIHAVTVINPMYRLAKSITLYVPDVVQNHSQLSTKGCNAVHAVNV